jgi:phage tail sheath protein FI
MPATLTYPGVYVDEVPSAVRTITGVPTSTAAFVGTAPRGPSDEPTHITSWADYQRTYGGLSADSLMSYSVYQFFQNGGSEAEIVRLVKDSADKATLDLQDGVELTALSAGKWANSVDGPPPAGLRARVDYEGLADNSLYNLTVRDMSPGGGTERYVGIDSAAASKRTIDVVLQSSQLVSSTGEIHTRPKASDPAPGKDPFLGEADKTYSGGKGGSEGSGNQELDYLGNAAEKTGLNQLLKTDIFNLLCVLPPRLGDPLPDGVLAAAVELCVDRRALLLVDPPPTWETIADAVDGAVDAPPVEGDSAKNAAIFFPRVSLPDPLDHGTAKAYPPSGAIAGVMARTDAQRGVWKAPAGIDASLNGARGPDVHMTDLENGRLNPLGVNCIRRFPLIGTVSWGSRTMRGADAFADQWKYIPVRRLALFIEEALFRGTNWVVFEPNDEPLWSSVRLNVGAFMNSLFRQGAFQGRTAREAYLVKCDKENNPQNDIDRGIVNILVGFAPLKPAEFVLIHIQQLNPAPLV